MMVRERERERKREKERERDRERKRERERVQLTRKGQRPTERATAIKNGSGGCGRAQTYIRGGTTGTHAPTRLRESHMTFITFQTFRSTIAHVALAQLQVPDLLMHG